MELYPRPEAEITAEEILLNLIRAASPQWNGKGVELWALRELAKIQADEQLKLFKDV